ncbi:hypothetical protein KI387_038384, partial [Taxus chinensis]
FTGLNFEWESIDDDMNNNETIKETVETYNYKKVSWYFDITGIQDPIMRMATSLVTNLNDQEGWTQVKKAWLN